ncbi:putative ABC transporter [Aureobasidium pullulans]|uniref:Putative ABC transporter n=1 Tax=Aureobasidium pullulans TaxID=5580 RepID=A0A4T0BLA9_AURPU|nr:putative ABC transporter [Aureobasidium pullulans]
MQRQTSNEFYMFNDVVRSLSWSNVTLTVEDRSTKQPRDLISRVNGRVQAGEYVPSPHVQVLLTWYLGEILALMGPSGSGKTTLLNILAGRNKSSYGTAAVNDASIQASVYKKLTSFVEQEDALVGSLTHVWPSLGTLSLSMLVDIADVRRSVLKAEKGTRVQNLIDSFGLKKQADTLIGTPIRKGISGGQKRRVSVASQLITAPKILFLDEPTSGLDSVASFEVISLLKKYAQQHQLIVVASIHQPSAATFQLFDKLLLLSQGQTCYFGAVSGVAPYFARLGMPVPDLMNPSEHILDLTNTDFDSEDEEGGTASQRLVTIQSAWKEQGNSDDVGTPILEKSDVFPDVQGIGLAHDLGIPVTLLHRLYLKSYRDIVTYWIRVAMYMGLAVMMGTVWLQLSTIQKDIQSFVNALFFGSAFLSFMAVAYVPAFLEDRAIFVKERANGLYGPLSFVVSNFLIGLPFLFLISILFATVTYWLISFRPDATAFFVHVMWLFLDLVAAESLVVLVSSLFPNFIIALALVAFANGLWMSVGGFLVPTGSLNVFWRYVFHYIDYQAYVFRGMMVNEFDGRTYRCAGNVVTGCSCAYESELSGQCKIDGKAVLQYYDYPTGQLGKTVGIMIGIIVVYRVLGYLALYFRK